MDRRDGARWPWEIQGAKSHEWTIAERSSSKCHCERSEAIPIEVRDTMGIASPSLAMTGRHRLQLPCEPRRW